MPLNKQHSNQHKTLKKVLLVYSSKPPIMQYLASAFSRKGISTEMVYADANHWFDRYIIHPANKMLHNFRIIPKDKSVFSGHPLSHKNYRSFNLKKAYRQFNPDLVLIIRGIGFQKDVLNEIRRNTPLFCWWIEREERIEEALGEINLFDWYFFINSSCVEEGLKRGHFNVSLLHHSVDPLVWHPVDAEKKYDWSFVGGWSAKRQEVIERALKVSVNAALYGPRWGKCCRFNSPFRRILKGDYIEGDPLLRLYSETRVVLNITNWGFGEGEKRSGMNMRVLEVPACGAFLLTDGSRDMSAMVRPGEHGVVYEGLEDFEKKLGYYLKNHSEREKIATAGRERVSKNYTYYDVAGIIAQRYASLMAMAPV